MLCKLVYTAAQVLRGYAKLIIFYIWCKRVPLTWHSLHSNHPQSLEDVASVGGSLSGNCSKRRRFVKAIRMVVSMKENKKCVTKCTFVKLMPLRAKTAKALNSTPGPSSRVKTTLVYEENLYINIHKIKRKQRYVKAKNKTNQSRDLYLIWPVRPWNYRFSSKYQKASDIIVIILARAKW